MGIPPSFYMMYSLDNDVALTGSMLASSHKHSPGTSATRTRGFVFTSRTPADFI